MGAAPGLAWCPQILHPACRFGAWARNEFHSERQRLGDDTGSMPRRRPSVSSTARRLLRDLGTFVWLGLTSPARLPAENLVLLQQLAICQERHTKTTRPVPDTL